MNLFEAFRQLDALNEDTFSVSDDGIKKLAEFEQNDDYADEISIIDIEAETEEELEDSYVGKVILDCLVCHSKLYKAKEEIEINEDETLANVGEECPYCYTSDGFKIIGEVANYNSEAATEESDVEDKEEAELEVKDDEVDNSEEKEEIEESFTESPTKDDEEIVVENGDAKTEPLTEATATMDRPMSRIKGTLGNVMSAHQDELSQVYDRQSAIDFLNTIEPEVRNKNYLATVKSKVSMLPDRKITQYLYDIILKGDGMGTKLESTDEENLDEFFDIEPNINLDASGQSVGLLGGTGGTVNNEEMEEDLLVRGEDGKLTTTSQDGRWGNSKEWNYNNEELEEGIFGIKTKKEKEKEAKAKAAKEAQKQRDKELKDQEERARQQSVADSWARYDRAARDAKAEYNRNRDSIKGDKPSNTGYRGVNYSGGDYYSESLTEDVNNVNVETDEDIINVSTDNNGKVTVTTEPKAAEAAAGEEIIAPVSDELETELLNNTSEEPVEDELEVADFDEESFDELGESYLKNIYENIESYRTTDVFANDKQIKVEGIIKFTSGNSKKTSFLFEAKDYTKRGKVRFIGENTQITRGKKAFTVCGKLNEGKFITESFNYNYKAKDAEGKSTRIYGTLRKR